MGQRPRWNQARFPEPVPHPCHGLPQAAALLVTVEQLPPSNTSGGRELRERDPEQTDRTSVPQLAPQGARDMEDRSAVSGELGERSLTKSGDVTRITQLEAHDPALVALGPQPASHLVRESQQRSVEESWTAAVLGQRDLVSHRLRHHRPMIGRKRSVVLPTSRFSKL